MTPSPFESFITFIEIDRSLRTAHRERDSLLKELEHIHSEKKVFQDRINKAQESIKETQKKVSSTELEIKSQKERQRELERRLEEVANPKEYMALQKEIEGISQALGLIEDTLLASWQEHEALEESRKIEETSLQTLEEKYKTREDEINKKIEELQRLITTLEADRAEKEKFAPEDFIQRYNDMHKLVADPVVPVLNNHCSACNCQLPSAVVGNLQRAILTQCPECYRLLYYVPNR